MSFVNRIEELSLLQQLYESRRAELFIVYGRRRVGKTELLRYFCQERPHIFFSATQTTDKNQLADWSRLLWQYAHGQPLPDFTFPTWEASFQFLATLAGEQRLVVVVDEFPYMIESNAALPSILQKLWDENLRHTQVYLILCGSSIGMMEQETLGYRSPLYGRRSGQLLLQPLDFTSARPFLKPYDLTTEIETYAVLGGMPAYLEQFDFSQSLEANIIDRILRPNRVLYDEPLFLLRTELREPRNYFAVLQAIAHGKTRPQHIAQASGVGDARMVSKYLSVLQELRLIERVVPVTETQPQKSRQGHYRLADQFLRFWFRFLAPHRSELEQGQAQLVWQNDIAPQLAQFTGPVFEEICRQFLWRLARTDQPRRLPFAPQQIGAWWWKEQEVDIVALNRAEEIILVGECKWRSRPVGNSVLADLRQAAMPLLLQAPPAQVYYALFAKAGFTTELLDQAATDPTLLLYDLETIAG
ncbi:MAG: ATPase AAA [Chloroflexota bacterium]|nr:MAG: ATPase AAA [Chloroflexota bacterium]